MNQIRNQTTAREPIGRSLIEIEQFGNIEILFLQEAEINPQEIVFLPEPFPASSFPNLARSTPPLTQGGLTIENSTSIHTAQRHAESLDLGAPELLWSDTTLPMQFHQGELNTPVIGQLEGFKFDIPTSLDSANKDLTVKKDQLRDISESGCKQTYALEFDSSAHFNILRESDSNNQQQQQAEEVTASNSYNSIAELLQDEQMFRLDQDFNNNHELGYKEEEDDAFGIPVLSDDYIPAIESLEMFDELCFGENSEIMIMEKTNKIDDHVQEVIAESHPEPVVADKHHQLRLQIPQQQQQQQTPIEAQETVKMEEDDFDLVNFIDSNEFTELTPFEEKPCPNFMPEVKAAVKLIEIKQEEPSTSSATSSRKVSVATIESDHQYDQHRPKRMVKRRRYSSDSDFSVGTSASSYNSTRQKVHKRKRGRPAKELIKVLPTIEDFKDLPVDAASHLVLRIKNNEASRKSRMKSKNQQDSLEEECNRLERRQNLLKETRDRLDGQIETLRKWLLGGL